MTARLITRLRSDRGTSALELAILTPLLIGLIALIIAIGRVSVAGQHVDGAAHNAARAASIQRTAGQAQQNASSTASAYLDQRGLSCTPQNVTVDTSGFAAELGETGTVEVSVSCTVSLQQVTGVLPIGQRTLTATAVSPIDAYRGRQ